MATSGGVQFNDLEQRCIFSWAFPGTEVCDSKSTPLHCRGIARVHAGDGSTCVLVGSSNGNVHVFQCESKKKIK